MSVIFIILIVVSLLAILLWYRKYVIKKAKESSDIIIKMTFKESSSKQKINTSDFNFKKILNEIYDESYITFDETEKLSVKYSPIYKKANSILAKEKSLLVKDEGVLQGFIWGYENLNKYIEEHNTKYLNDILTKQETFFDSILKYPLDKQQRRAIVSEEDNCLVISSAGSGKTSSIMGKVQYLIKVKGVDPNKILLISYTNKAAAELTNRLQIPGLRGYTFHKLALDIISYETKIKPSICENTSKLFLDVFLKQQENPKFIKSIVEYFIDFEEFQTEDDLADEQKREQLSEEKENKFRALLPDMDNKSIYVRSQEEKKLCYALSSLGLRFRYEEPYEHKVADENHSQYRPDFSIYYNKDGKEKRAYLEHFGVDEHDQVPTWFAEKKGITLEEANKKYNDGITWKRELHKEKNTLLLETKSADLKFYDLKSHLKKILKKAGVPYTELTDSELMEQILPRESGKDKVFLKLIVTFISLVKSNCCSINDIIKSANNAHDSRSEFIIKNLITPIYEGYRNMMAKAGEMDFTDLIINATAICEEKKRDYDYIIVDEFQDISMDRYKFLSALRNGKHKAKLFCVGDDWQSIYRFSGSDLSLFCNFEKYFGKTETNRIESTYRFGEPMVSLSSRFIMQNPIQIKKNIHPFNTQLNTTIQFYSYRKYTFANAVKSLVGFIPADKSVFLIGRYSFDDMLLNGIYPCIKRGGNVYYVINDREVEFLTAHKSKGLEADYVILLNCNSGTFGFPSTIEDDPVIKYTLREADQFLYGEERRLFYVAITRAKIKTMVLYDEYHPSAFVNEMLNLDKYKEDVLISRNNGPRNKDKIWTRKADNFLAILYKEGKSISYIAEKMGRSTTSIKYRLRKLKDEGTI
ncbi:MAG: UvrD-helicase domain-containing protein [Bacteroidaceae bacterium]|nr:UvrD-helicase domain-containing protein [Bacteroidaceae bacterium]